MLTKALRFLLFGYKLGSPNHLSKHLKIMGINCGTVLAKYFLCFLNFVFFITSGLILTIGLWLYFHKNSLLSLLKLANDEEAEKLANLKILEDIAFLIIAAGAIMFLLSFLGYCGALRESTCLLNTYGVLLVITLVLELVACFLILVFYNQITAETGVSLKRSLKEYNEQKNEGVTLAWDKMMRSVGCCGINSYKDFTTPLVPEACCKPGFDCQSDPNSENSNYKRGCLRAMEKAPRSNIIMLICVFVGLLIFQIFLIVLAFCLSKSIDQMCMCHLLSGRCQI